jgi:hypothetical protein
LDFDLPERRLSNIQDREKEVDPFKGVSRPGLLLQPVSLNMISHFSRNGGNALGLTDEDGPLIRMW